MTIDKAIEPSFKCDCCGMEVRASLGEWLGDIGGSPFYCQWCYDQMILDTEEN